MSIVIEKIIDSKDINVCPLLREEDYGKDAYWEVECTEEDFDFLGFDVLDIFESQLVDVYGGELE